MLSKERKLGNWVIVDLLSAEGRKLKKIVISKPLVYLCPRGRKSVK